MTKSEARFISDTLARAIRALNQLTLDKKEWEHHVKPINDDMQAVYDAAREEINK